MADEERRNAENAAPCLCVWTWPNGPESPVIEVISPSCPHHGDDALHAIATRGQA